MPANVFLDIYVAIETFDLLGYVKNHQGEEAQTGEWVVTCPVCLKDKLAVNITTKTWHCWVCEQYAYVPHTAQGTVRRSIFGAGGLLDLIQLLDNVSKIIAVGMVLEGTFTKPEDLQQIPDSELIIDILGNNRLDAGEPIPFPLHAVEVYGNMPFLKNRGITQNDVQHFGLFGCDAGLYNNRLVFPVWENRRFVYFQARAMWEPKPGEKHKKVLNPPKSRGSLGATDVLMNLDAAKQYQRVAITEGPIDCVHAGYDAVCTFGKKISPTQIAKMIKAGVKAVDLMWDADAYDNAIQYAPQLTPFFDTKIVRLPQGDPGDYRKEDLLAFRYEAQKQNVVNYLEAV